MTEEGLTNSDLELKLVNQSNDLIKLQTNFNVLQIKFNEEKEKTFNFEKKITFLENELKEIKEKIQKLESDHKNEIESSKQIFKNIVEEKVMQVKNENDIILKFVNNVFEEKIADLTIKFEQLNNVTCKIVKFVKIKNKWKTIAGKYIKCCDDNCINQSNPIGNCIKGNGFINLINDEYIKYINCVEGKGKDIDVIVRAENSFERPLNCSTYSLFYFEIKCKIERELSNYLTWMVIGVGNTNNFYKFLPKNGVIVNEKNEEFKVSKFSWNDNDVFGCGLIYPPTNTEEFPYIFFTQNGTLMGKALFLKDNSSYYEPYVILECCSVEANFGNNLEKIPFIYDISKYFVSKEFY